MEIMQSLTIKSSVLYLPLLVLYFFSAKLCHSSAYTRPEKYFINCGSSSSFITPSRTFIGDVNSSSFALKKKKSSTVEDVNKSTTKSLLYQTARIFRQQSSYEFETTIKGTYLVRLHFFAFSSPANLSGALFDVSASGFSLLRNFSVGNGSNSPVIKEFFLSVNFSKFTVYFVPRESFFAFVNAIEVFPLPDSFFPDEAPHVSSMGTSGSFSGLLSKALMTIHRINVGGCILTPDNDTLWRYWIPDDSYLQCADAAKNTALYTFKLNYPAGVSRYTAPDSVYQSAKEMNIDSSSSRDSNFFNITWSFKVSENTRHFIRIHFCDIVSPSNGDIVFDLYIYSKFSHQIDSYQTTQTFDTPFFDDFMVDSDDSGLLNISIGPRRDSEYKNAFLNGVEIMEILGESGSKSKHKIHLSVIISTGLGSLALASILTALLAMILRRRKSKTAATRDWSSVQGCSRAHNGIVISSIAPNISLGLKISLAEIQFATKNFDAKMKIGKGGFGTVFRGSLKNGTKVAVKRGEPGSGQGFPEFQTEIMVLSRIHHRHLVSLIGYCDEKSEMILIYEFMERGTLRDHLYKSAFPPLSWKQRLEICIGAARGLHYLHRGASGGFIHRDIKSTNILLDENYVAKVADFGISRLGDPNQTHVSTCIKGTFGYLDPVYFRTQRLTEKSDVYSFGVVLLEVLCARPAIDTLLPRDQVNLADWWMFCKDQCILDHIIDPTIKGHINPNSLRKFSETAEKCLLEYESDRPTMADVLWDLEYALQLQQTATWRGPHEDSRTDNSSMPIVQTFPSVIYSEKDDVPILSGDNSNSLAAEIFSQLRMDEARYPL